MLDNTDFEESLVDDLTTFTLSISLKTKTVDSQDFYLKIKLRTQAQRLDNRTDCKQVMAPSVVRANHAYNPNLGFWGDVTASIDWCEGNYEVSYYIAEFWNSVSNLAFIVPPLVVAYKLRKDLDTVYLMSLIYMAFTGCGSFAFHATLKIIGQLWDELSMVWSGLFILYLILIIRYPKVPNYRFSIALIAYGVFTNFIYLGTNYWTLFEVSYAVIHLSVVSFAWNLHDKSDKRLYWSTVVMSTTGFILWNIDNNFCDSLEKLRSLLLNRSEVPSTLIMSSSPLSLSCLVPLTQLHALWHCLAGYGAFSLVLYCIQAKLNLEKEAAVKTLSSLSSSTMHHKDLSSKSYFTVCFDYFSGITLEKQGEEIKAATTAGQESWQVENTVKEELTINCKNDQDHFACQENSRLPTGRPKEHERAVTSAGDTIHDIHETNLTSSHVTHRISPKNLRGETSPETSARDFLKTTSRFLIHEKDEVLNSGFMRESCESSDNRYTQMLKEHDKDRKRD